MSDSVIKVEDVSKMYRLGTLSSGSLVSDVNRFIAKVRGKEDPYAIIGTNERTTKADSEYVWSLKDINFDIKQGDAVGIIGRNGAGKSTLLKILSRVTAPTTGTLKIKGRIASLLEVGTGFHPELSGRDNIFMNGSILGMSRAEIRSKFDEIVDFAGVEKYIDTPVKRYSSGMYVRLAFAVAAHLEPDILIVDEVLAVGDVEFQKKCLGKMQDVNNKEGRTVLFVSHNMAAIKLLCNTSILLENGSISYQGDINQSIQYYFSGHGGHEHKMSYTNNSLGERPYILRSSLKNNLDENVHTFENTDAIIIESELASFNVKNLVFTLLISNSEGDVFIHSTDEFDHTVFKKAKRKCTIPKKILKKGIYFVTMALGTRDGDLFEKIENELSFEVKSSEEVDSKNLSWKGLLSPNVVLWEF